MNTSLNTSVNLNSSITSRTPSPTKVSSTKYNFN